MLFPLFFYRFSAFRASVTGKIPDVRGMFMVSDFILQGAELDLGPDFSKEGVRYFFSHNFFCILYLLQKPNCLS